MVQGNNNRMYSKQTTQQLIIHEISDMTNCEMSEIRPETDLVRELGLDSLDRAELSLKLDTMFHIEIVEKEAKEWRTIADIIDSVENYLTIQSQ